MFYGFRIEHDNGHRYIVVDLDADFLPKDVADTFLPRADEERLCVYIKHYGSVCTALDEIDAMLASSGTSTTKGYVSFLNRDTQDAEAVFGLDR